MNKKYIVRLAEEERHACAEVIKKLNGSSQKVRQAQILLKADVEGPAWTDARIAEAFGCRIPTIENLRKRLVTEGFERAMRDLLELLTGCGWRTRAFCGPTLDFEQAVEFPALLGEQGIAVERRECAEGTAPYSLFHFRLGRMPATVYAPAQAEAKEPSREEGSAYLALLERVLERERPKVMLTYGGQWVAREAMRLARRRGVRVAFALHNFAYHDRSLFEAAHAVLVPSRFSAEHYRRHLGLECTAIPNPVNWDRVRCEPDPKRRPKPGSPTT